MNESSSVSIQDLQEFIPLFSLSEERLRELATLCNPETYPPDAQLFRAGDLDKQSLYLLSGTVVLRGPAGETTEIAAGTAEARHPLADQQPRTATGIAATDVAVLRIDNNVLDYMITWDQLAGMERGGVTPKSGSSAVNESGWMERVGNALAFRNIPPANMQELLSRMEKISVHQGDVIVNQGEPGDYYYLINHGRAKVTCMVELARLGEGASFGEEALVAGTTRNATVTMTSDGELMRLSKQDFDELLKGPLINWISPDEAREAVNRGARWLDVRHAKEFSHYRLPNAINIPLHELRQRMDELNPDVCYVCYCQTSRRSSAAAFVLTQAGYDVRVLRGGLRVLPPALRKEPRFGLS